MASRLMRSFVKCLFPKIGCCNTIIAFLGMSGFRILASIHGRSTQNASRLLLKTSRFLYDGWPATVPILLLCLPHIVYQTLLVRIIWNQLFQLILDIDCFLPDEPIRWRWRSFKKWGSRTKTFNVYAHLNFSVIFSNFINTISTCGTSA